MNYQNIQYHLLYKNNIQRSRLFMTLKKKMILPKWRIQQYCTDTTKLMHFPQGVDGLLE